MGTPLSARSEMSDITDETRRENLQALFATRLSEISYLQRLHKGGVYWMNVVGVTHEDIMRGLYDTSGGKPPLSSARVEDWFSLGTTLGAMLDLSPGPQYVRALAQALDHASSAPLSHELTYMLQSDSSIMTFGDENDPVKPKVHVAGSRSWYMYLQAPTMPISLDPFEVLFSLTDVLLEVYSLLNHPESIGQAVYYDAIIKIDMKINKLVISPIVKDMESLTRSMCASQISSLDSIFAFAAEFRIDEGHP